MQRRNSFIHALFAAGHPATATDDELIRFVREHGIPCAQKDAEWSRRRYAHTPADASAAKMFLEAIGAARRANAAWAEHEREIGPALRCRRAAAAPRSVRLGPEVASTPGRAQGADATLARMLKRRRAIQAC